MNPLDKMLICKLRLLKLSLVNIPCDGEVTIHFPCSVKIDNIFRKNFTSWLMDKIRMIGLESYQQKFAVEFPEELSLLNEPIDGTNVYGILRAPRMARTEALVLLTPLKSESSGPFYELVFLLSLAEHFRSKSVLACHLVFRFVHRYKLK